MHMSDKKPLILSLKLSLYNTEYPLKRCATNSYSSNKLNLKAYN